MIVDLGGIKAGDGSARKQMPQKINAGGGEFIQHQTAAGDFCQDGEKACSGRRLKHMVPRGDLRSSQCRKPHGQRRRELLEAFHLFRPPRMGRQQV